MAMLPFFRHNQDGQDFGSTRARDKLNRSRIETERLRLTELRDFFVRGVPHESPVRQQKRGYLPRRGIDITKVIAISTAFPSACPSFLLWILHGKWRRYRWPLALA